MNFFRWLTSRRVRQATEFCRQANRMLNEQRDLLSHEAQNAVGEAISELRSGIHSGVDPAQIKARMDKLESTANAWLKPYPNASARENVKEIFMALTLILSFTTFFLQLTKIPTGSLQPTLYGISHENLMDRPGAAKPNLLKRFVHYWVWGATYYELIAKDDGPVTFSPPRSVVPFVKRQTFMVGDTPHTLWMFWSTYDDLARRAGIVSEGGEMRTTIVRKGEPIFRLKVIAGDHLFVDRISYNFRRPTRGEIIVFKTRGIQQLPQDQLYIKRLVALENERVRIGDDNHLVINGRRLNAATPGFENVYSFDPAQVPQNGERYFGHVNGKTAQRLRHSFLSPLFSTQDEEQTVRPDHAMVMGDNTLNSFDSRAWGDFSERNIIGKGWFVYWPISSRFGLGYR